MANSMDPHQTAPIRAVCSGSTMFASILNLSVMLGNYLQQTTSTDDIFRSIFSWRFKGLSVPSTADQSYLSFLRSVVASRIYKLCAKHTSNSGLT